MEVPQDDNVSSTQNSNVSLSSVINTSCTKINSHSENDIKSLENIGVLDSSLGNSEKSLNGSRSSHLSKSHSGSNNSKLNSCSSLRNSHSLNNSFSSGNNLSVDSNSSLNKSNKLLCKDHKRRMKQNLFITLSKSKEEELILDDIEKKLLEHLEWIGFNTNAILESIKNHSCNELSATWYLLLRKHKGYHYSSNTFDDNSVFCPSAEPWATGSKSSKFELQPYSAPIRSSFTTNANNKYLWATGTRKDYLNGVMKKNSPKLSTISQKQILNSNSNSYSNSPVKLNNSAHNSFKQEKSLEELNNNLSVSNSNQIMEEEEEEEIGRRNSEFSFTSRKSPSSYSSISNRSLLTNRILQIQQQSSESDNFKKDFIKNELPISAKIPTSNIVYSNSYSGGMNMMVHNINGTTKTYSPFLGRPKPRRSTLPSSFPNHFTYDEDGNESSSNLISVDEEEGYEEEDYSSSYTCSSVKCKANEETQHPASSLVINSPLTMTTMIDANDEIECNTSGSRSNGSTDSIIGSRVSSEDSELDEKADKNINSDQLIQKKPALPTQNELDINNSFNKFVKEKYSSNPYGKNVNNSSSTSTSTITGSICNYNEKSVNDFTSSPRFINYTNSQFSSFSQFYSPSQNNESIKLDIPDKFIAKSTTSRSSSGISETSGYNNEDFINYFHQPETNQTNNRTSY